MNSLNYMRKRIDGLFACLFAIGALAACTDKSPRYVGYVDPLIGSGGHGHVFVGASQPFGMVQLGPTSLPQQWDWTSGYHDSDSSVIGFSHTHLSGTGIGDLFDVTVMPVTGKPKYGRGSEDDPESGLWSYADRREEIAQPGYYSVPLLRYGIRAELTATQRVGVHRYTFPASDEAAIVFDLENGGCWDEATETGIEIVDSVSLRGWRHSTGWAKNQKQWFYATLSKPFDAELIHKDGQARYARLNFSTSAGERVMLKVALSPTGCEGAETALAEEAPGWDFDAYRKAASMAWDGELGKIDIRTSDEDARKVFYTALYHTMVAPSLFCDRDGSHMGADGIVRPDPGYRTYTTYSLWDTYRAAMPLYFILHPSRSREVALNFIDIFEQQGKLPVWHLMGNETDCMVGNPGAMVLADAITKGILSDDTSRQRAYKALRNSVMLDERGQGLRREHGYIPSDLLNESCASDMEYAIADAAVARAAEAMELEADAAYFEARSGSWKHYFDPSTGFVRGRLRDGSWRTPFNPFSATHRADDYCEGNAWQYTWLVPHDLPALMEAFGGRDRMLARLDSLFTAPSEVDGDDASPDISGLIGQYAHGNEPSHHVAYFYTMAGQPWKSAELVREILSGQYAPTRDGLSGNEDVGQMSAWYVLSALGFYQVEPAVPRFWFGSPLFEKTSVKVSGGTFTIEAIGNSPEKRYIRRVFLNGKPWPHPFIGFENIVSGGTLTFEMDSKPHTWYCWQDSFAETPDRRPAVQERLFHSQAVEEVLASTAGLLSNPKLRQMFLNCFPNTLDTTVHPDGDGGCFVYTGDIPAMWLRDSGAQVWPYVGLCSKDPDLAALIRGVLARQFRQILTDPYANAFNVVPKGQANPTDFPVSDPNVFERKWEIDSHCYPLRLAYAYWKETGDGSPFGDEWICCIKTILDTFREQQRFGGHGAYTFLRTTDRQLDTKCLVGRGNPVRPCGLIASAFRPSDDATTFEFLVPSNFMAVSSLRKAAVILSEANGDEGLAGQCRALADEVEEALRTNAVAEHPQYGPIYAFEVDGFGNKYLMDDANVPSLLSLAYLDPAMADDPIWRNTRRFVLGEDNPYFLRGAAGEGIGGPHIGVENIWPMSIMMRAFTSSDDDEILDCILTLLNTDAGTGLIHESFTKDDASDFTREWFAWQNSLFGELILKLINEGKTNLLNSISR